jgi:hypothetical protein
VGSAFSLIEPLVDMIMVSSGLGSPHNYFEFINEQLAALANAAEKPLLPCDFGLTRQLLSEKRAL